MTKLRNRPTNLPLHEQPENEFRFRIQPQILLAAWQAWSPPKVHDYTLSAGSLHPGRRPCRFPFAQLASQFPHECTAHLSRTGTRRTPAPGTQSSPNYQILPQKTSSREESGSSTLIYRLRPLSRLPLLARVLSRLLLRLHSFRRDLPSSRSRLGPSPPPLSSLRLPLA